MRTVSIIAVIVATTGMGGVMLAVEALPSCRHGKVTALNSEGVHVCPMEIATGATASPPPPFSPQTPPLSVVSQSPLS